MLPRLAVLHLITAFGIAAVPLLMPVDPSVADDLNNYKGRWVGSGYLEFRGDTREKISCRATYFAHRAKQRLIQNLRCVSVAGHKFEFRGELFSKGTGLFGSWIERFSKSTGELNGICLADGFQLAVKSFHGDAVLRLHRRDNTQRISIKTGGKFLKRIDI